MRIRTTIAGFLVLSLAAPAAMRAGERESPRSDPSGGHTSRSQSSGDGSSSGSTSGSSGGSSSGNDHWGSWDGSHRRHSRNRSSWRVGVSWGGWGGWGGYGGWGGWWGWGPYGYAGPYAYYGPSWGYPATYSGRGSRLGALDLDVSPEKAEIWLDGSPIGVADDFDGYPNYLWLEPGTYDVVIYRPGFRTIARQYSIYPGLVIDVNDRMTPGEAIHPNDLPAKTHDRRDERLRRDREAQARVERASPEAWAARGGGPLDARGEPSRIRLSVSPEDASVYLDGRFLGTGKELGRLRAGLLVDPGSHVLEVVRPGYESSRRTVEVESGAEESVDVDLAAGG